MKTTKKRMLNIVIAMSIAINVVMLGGVSYMAAQDNYVKKIHSAMKLPVVIYIPKTMEISSVKIATPLPATQ
jgi:hypothetical protein